MLSLACFLCHSVGTAEMGTAPGSVRVVLACEARANDINMAYIMLNTNGMPPVTAKKVTVTSD